MHVVFPFYDKEEGGGNSFHGFGQDGSANLFLVRHSTDPEYWTENELRRWLRLVSFYILIFDLESLRGSL